jgi:hypothetical protein
MASPEMLNALLQQMGQLTAAMLAQQNQQAIPAAAGFAAEATTWI